MKKALISILLSFILSPVFTVLTAQQAMLTNGNTNITSNAPKQVVYADNTVASVAPNEEKKHKLEFSVVSSLDAAKDIVLTQTNNSLEDYFTLSFNTSDKQLKSGFSYQVYDMSGKLWINKDITYKKTKVLMNELPSASYYIMVFKNDQAVKIFKILKKLNI